MGAKHPAPGPVFIVSKSKKSAITISFEDGEYSISTIPYHDDLSPREDAGWTIFNVPNDENTERMGYNLISHNKYPNMFLHCNSDGTLTVSKVNRWDSGSGWKLLQFKDLDYYQMVCHNQYWMTINGDSTISMKMRGDLPGDDSEYWTLKYVSKNELKRKVPIMEREERKQTETQNILKEQLIDLILKRENDTKRKSENNSKSKKWMKSTKAIRAPNLKTFSKLKDVKDLRVNQLNRLHPNKKRMTKPTRSLLPVDSESDHIDIEGSEDEMKETYHRRGSYKQLRDRKGMSKSMDSSIKNMQSSMNELKQMMRSLGSEIQSMKIEVQTVEHHQRNMAKKIHKRLDELQYEIRHSQSTKSKTFGGLWISDRIWTVVVTCVVSVMCSISIVYFFPHLAGG